MLNTIEEEDKDAEVNVTISNKDPGHGNNSAKRG